MLFLINVGHQCSLINGHFQAAHVAKALEAEGWLPLAVHRSNTELTTVAVKYTGTVGAMLSAGAVCDRMRQDCVAVMNARNGDGMLVGHKAKDWGPFNPKYFILPDGSRAG